MLNIHRYIGICCDYVNCHRKIFPKLKRRIKGLSKQRTRTTQYKKIKRNFSPVSQREHKKVEITAITVIISVSEWIKHFYVNVQ